MRWRTSGSSAFSEPSDEPPPSAAWREGPTASSASTSSASPPSSSGGAETSDASSGGNAGVVSVAGPSSAPIHEAEAERCRSAPVRGAKRGASRGASRGALLLVRGALRSSRGATPGRAGVRDDARQPRCRRSGGCAPALPNGCPPPFVPSGQPRFQPISGPRRSVLGGWFRRFEGSRASVAGELGFTARGACPRLRGLRPLVLAS